MSNGAGRLGPEGRLVAVELDTELLPLLRERFAARPQVSIVQGDVLEIAPGEVVREMSCRGVRCFVYTPIEADGMLTGPVVEDLTDIADTAAEAGAELIYSGGIGSTDDLHLCATGHVIR